MPVNTTCDICGKEFNQDILYNFYPELNEKIKDLKEKYKDFDGMACIDCYVDHMATEESLKDQLKKILWSYEKRWVKAG